MILRSNINISKAYYYTYRLITKIPKKKSSNPQCFRIIIFSGLVFFFLLNHHKILHKKITSTWYLIKLVKYTGILIKVNLYKRNDTYSIFQGFFYNLVFLKNLLYLKYMLRPFFKDYIHCECVDKLL